MTRRKNPSQKSKTANRKQRTMTAVKRTTKHSSSARPKSLQVQVQGPPKSSSKTDKTARKLEDILTATNENSSSPDSKKSQKLVAVVKGRGRLSNDENDPLSPSKQNTRRSTRAATLKGKYSSYYDEVESTIEEDDDDDSDDDDADASIMSSPGGKKKVTGTTGRGMTMVKTPKILNENNKKKNSKPLRPQILSPKKKQVMGTAGTPLRSDADFKRPSPASSSIKEITRNMWQENTTDWRVESAMDY